jgi:hypothetical protein
MVDVVVELVEAATALVEVKIAVVVVVPIVVVERIVVVVRLTNVVVLDRGRRGVVVVVPVVGPATRVVVVLVDVVEVVVPLDVDTTTLFLTEVAASEAASFPAAS